MQTILNYIKVYVQQADKRVLAVATLFTGLLVFINYRYNLDGAIRNNSSPVKLLAWYGVSAVAFIGPYLFAISTGVLKKTPALKYSLLLLLAPLIFALKLSLDLPLQFTDDPVMNHYWNHIFYWPLMLLIIGSILFILWKWTGAVPPFYGLRTKGIAWKPYWLMLLIMLPLVALASTQPDFLAAYPKLQAIEGIHGDERITLWHKLLFELSYGSDFITIELFFRGFLVLAFVKWAGKEAILPMACFYCTIHFGKPMAECISSYFGGIILGIVVYNTRSIAGGLAVHLGIAWMMEIGGYVGNMFVR